MVFVLYKIHNSEIVVIGVYENKDDAQYNKEDCILNTSLENIGISKYVIDDAPYFKHVVEPPMKYSEEDNDIEEDDYYELLDKCKDQNELIKILESDIKSLKNDYNKILNMYKNDSFTLFILSVLIILVFSGCFLVCVM